MKITKHKLFMLIISMLIITIFSTIGGCIKDPGKDLSFELSVSNLTVQMEGVEGVNQWIYTFNWITQASAESILYINEGSTYDETIATPYETIEGTQVRSVDVPAIIPLREYAVHIESTRGRLTAQLDNDYTFTAPERPPQNSIIGQIDYTESNQTAGDFVIERWKDAEYLTGEPGYIEIIYEEDWDNGVTEFSIPAGPEEYKLRIFRDFDNNRAYDSETDALFESSTISVEDVDVPIGDCSLIEPPEQVNNINFLYPAENVGMVSGHETTIRLEVINQWGNVLNGQRTIVFSADDATVLVSPGYEQLNYDGSVITDYIEYNIALEKASGATTTPSTTLTATIDDPVIGGVSKSSQVSFTLSLNLIYLTIEYEMNGKYTGDLVIQVDEDNAGTWNHFTTRLNESSDTPLTTDIGDVYNIVYEIPADNSTPGYKIRVFRDENSNSIPNNSDTYKEAYGLAEWYTGDPAGGGTPTGLTTIEINNEDEYAKVEVREPILKPTSLNIINFSDYSIFSGDTIDVTVEMLDQWGGDYEDDGTFYYDGNPDGDYDLDPQTLAFTSTNEAEVSLVGTEITETGTLNGSISTTLELHKLTTGLDSRSTQIRIEWENGVNPSYTSIDSNFVEVDNNHIIGSFTYNQTIQPNGTLKVEMFDGADFSTANLIQSDYDGDTNFNFEVNDSDNADYYFRVYRDFNNDGYDDSDPNNADGFMDAYLDYSTTPINVNHSDVTGVNLGTLNDKTQYIYELNITGLSTTSLVSGTDITIDLETLDQWGELYGASGTETINFIWNNNDGNVALGDTQITLDSSGTDSLTTSLTNIASGAPHTGYITASINSTATKNIERTVNSNNITVNKNQISGTITYTGTNYGGAIIVEAFDNASFLGSAVYTGVVTPTGDPTIFDYTISNVDSAETLYLRAYKDYNSDGHTSLTDPDGIYNDVYEGIPTPIATTGDNIQNIDFTIYEPNQEINSISIATGGQPSSSIRSGQDVTVTIETFDQWGNAYGNGETVTFSWTGSNVSFDRPSDTITAGGTTSLTITLTNDDTGSNSGGIQFTANSKSVTTNNITVNRNQITGTVSYNVASAKQPGGRIKVEAWSDASYSVTRYDFDVASSDGTSPFSYTLTNIPSNETSVYVRAYLDYDNSDNTYVELTDGFGEFGSGIAMGGADQTADFDIDTEQPQEVDSISIATGGQPSSSIRSGQDVTVTIETFDQWGSAYGNGETVTFSWTGSNVSFDRPSDTITAGGTTSLTITLTNDDAGSNSGAIQFTSNSKSVTTNNITVNGNQITGTVSYNVASPKQPGGRIKVEAWSDASYSVTRYDFDVASSDGTSPFSYTLTNIPSNETSVYVRAYLDYDNSDNTYVELTDGFGEFGSGIAMGGADQTADFDIDTEQPQVITSTTITTGISSTEIKSGTNVTFTITSKDQWEQVYGDTSKDFNHNWLGSFVIISPTFTDIESDGTTLIDVTLTGSGVDETNKIESEYETSGIVVQTSNVRVDGEKPTVSSSAPTGTGALPGTNVTVTFSETMNQASAEGAFSLVCSSSGTLTGADGSIGWAGDQLVFDPTSDLVSEETCTIEISTSAQDTLGNAIASPYSSSGFTIVDGEAPTVNSISPTTGTEVTLTTNIIVTFSEEMNQTTAQDAFTLDCGADGTLTGADGSFIWTPGGDQMTFDPTSGLPSEASCTIKISTVAEDLSGNPFASAYTSDAFTTEDVTSPSLVSAISSNTDDTQLILTFDETLGTNASLDTGAFTVTESGQGSQAQSVTAASASGTSVTLTISPGVSNGGTSLNLDYDKAAFVNIIKDDSANANEVANFSTAVTNDSGETTAPSYVDMVLAGGGNTITLRYDEELNSGSVPAAGDFSLEMYPPPTTLTISTISVTGNTVVITINETLTAGDNVDVVYTPGTNPIEDVKGNDAVGDTYTESIP